MRKTRKSWRQASQEQLVFFTSKKSSTNWSLYDKIAYRDQQVMELSLVFGKLTWWVQVVVKIVMDPLIYVAEQALT